MDKAFLRKESYLSSFYPKLLNRKKSVWIFSFSLSMFTLPIYRFLLKSLRKISNFGAQRYWRCHIILYVGRCADDQRQWEFIPTINMCGMFLLLVIFCLTQNSDQRGGCPCFQTLHVKVTTQDIWSKSLWLTYTLDPLRTWKQMLGRSSGN